MRKVAVFTEGQSEQVFMREFLFRIVDPSKLSFLCLKLNADRMERVREYSSPSPEVHFEIVNVQNDERVLSVIRETEQRLFARGFEKVIGLRDMYSGAYVKRSGGTVSESVTQGFIRAHHSVVQGMQHSSRISLLFAIMEIEAWFLGMHGVFAKLDPDLTVGNIKDKLGIDLVGVDPQSEFLKPSRQVEQIFDMCGRRYDKRLGDSEHIAARMESAHFDEATANGRCASFAAFRNEMAAYIC